MRSRSETRTSRFVERCDLEFLDIYAQKTAQQQTTLHYTSQLIPTLAQELGNALLLALHNLHRLVSVIQIVPARCLVRRITSPDLAKGVDVLGLWAI